MNKLITYSELIESYAKLTDKEKAAVDWAVEKEYNRTLKSVSLIDLDIVKHNYKKGIFQIQMRNSIAARPELLKDFIGEYEQYLKAEHGIGSKDGRSR